MTLWNSNTLLIKLDLAEALMRSVLPSCSSAVPLLGSCDRMLKTLSEGFDVKLTVFWCLEEWQIICNWIAKMRFTNMVIYCRFFYKQQNVELKWLLCGRCFSVVQSLQFYSRGQHWSGSLVHFMILNSFVRDNMYAAYNNICLLVTCNSESSSSQIKCYLNVRFSKILMHLNTSFTWS